MKIALIQLRVDNSKQNNLDRACAFIAQSKQGGADMAILPEMFSCPYQTKNFPLYAEKAGGKAWLQLSETARKNNIYLVAGSMPEVDEEGKVYNTSFVFDREGAQLASHRKTHMFDIDVPGGQRFRESDTLTPGDKVTTFETEFGLMGLLVCYDFRFPEMSRIMANRGAKVIFVPAAFNMTTGPAHWDLLFRCRAQDFQVFTVGCAPARDEGGCYVSYANSMVVGPWGDVKLRMATEESMEFCDIDLNELKKVRTSFPLWNHYRKGLYEAETSK